jgi:hypothetical protein
MRKCVPDGLADAQAARAVCRIPAGAFPGPVHRRVVGRGEERVDVDAQHAEWVGHPEPSQCGCLGGEGYGLDEHVPAENCRYAV